jgi:aminopeptidase N
MRTEDPRTIRLADYAPPAFLVDRVELEFDLEPDSTVVKAMLKMRRNGGDGPLRLDGEDLELRSVALDGITLHEVDYVVDGEGMTILSVPAEFTLETVVAIDPQSNTRLEGLYRTDGTWCTQCEAEGFRRITYFLDRPDVMATYCVTIRASAKEAPVLLSNGNKVEEGELGDGRHYAVWDDPFPKPSYLFALVAGNLGAYEDSFVTMSGRKVDLAIWVEPGNEPRCEWAMESLKRSMKWDEMRFGLEYDLDLFNIVAISAFNMGAMENKSLNVFNSKYILADPETATDADYEAIESIVAHEYFHNWTGNRVTCRDWFQLSLKEGLTVFRDQEFSADMRSRAVQRIKDVRALRAAQFPEDAGPLAHPVRPDSYIEINNFYTATVYEKGSEVIRMMHTLLGEDGFQEGMKLYFARHDGQAVTCDDFAAAMADANDIDLDHFKLWYSQAGTPELHLDEGYADGTYSLTVEQRLRPTPGQETKEPMQIPLVVGLLDDEGAPVSATLADSGKALPDGSFLLSLTKRKQTFRFRDVACKPVLSFNRGFSAPVKVSGAADRKTDAVRMAYDPDPFNRWEAGQQYALSLILDGIEEWRAGRTPRLAEDYLESLSAIMSDASLEKAFAAEAIQLPGIGFVAESMSVIDVEGIDHVRTCFREEIARRLRDRLLELWHANASDEDYAPTAGQAGARALRNAALSYLAVDDDTSDLARRQYAGATNMTDRMAALACLVDIGGHAADDALEDFYDRFRKYTEVLDKWFALQAGAHRPDVLDRVSALLGHPDFSMRNPNKVRSLVGAFSQRNLPAFHAADGSGYGFLADRVIEIDPINPQVAARLVQPLGRWQRFDADRQSAMKVELKRILEVSNLSRDVYEIVSKSIG